jgi:hypothetical protein
LGGIKMGGSLQVEIIKSKIHTTILK